MKKLIFILAIFVSSLFVCSSHTIVNDTEIIIKSEYYSSGNIKDQFFKIGSQYKVVRYFDNGSIEEIGYYNSISQKTGEWVRYHSDGKLSGVANYKDGLKHGFWKIYNSEGNMIVHLKYNKGKRVESFIWSEDKGIVCD